MLAVNARHGEIGEAFFRIVVESRLLHAVVKARVVALHDTRHRAEAELPAQFAAEDLLVGEVIHEVVLHARRNEAVACQGGVALCAHACEEVVAGTQAIVERKLSAAAEEARLATLAEGVVGCAAVAHQTLALHLRTVDVCAEVKGEAAVVVAVLRPGAGLIDIYIIVVSELVAHADLAVGVVQVVLRHNAAFAVVACGELVDVGVAQSAEQVVHRFVVHAFGRVELNAHGILAVLIDGVIESRVEGKHHLVVVAAFHVVERIASRGGMFLIDEIHAVPVDLPISLVGSPIVVKGIVFFEEPRIFGKIIGRILPFGVVNIKGARGQILVIVGAGVVGVAVPTECRGAIHGILETGRSGEFHVIVNLPVPSKNGRRLIVVHHASITLLAALITPVGIIIVGVGEPIGLLGGGTLLRALRRRTEGNE